VCRLRSTRVEHSEPEHPSLRARRYWCRPARTAQQRSSLRLKPRPDEVSTRESALVVGSTELATAVGAIGANPSRLAVEARRYAGRLLPAPVGRFQGRRDFGRTPLASHRHRHIVDERSRGRLRIRRPLDKLDESRSTVSYLV
jgi:hypothetical protein